MLRIATYNMQNLFDDLAADGSHVPKPPTEIAALIRTIDAMRADLIGAQEIASLRALKALNARLRDPYPYVKLARGNSARGIHLGFLSRRPLRISSHRQTVLRDLGGRELQDFPNEKAAALGRLCPLLFQRDCLLARVDLGGGRRLVVFNVHLKSRRNYRWMKHNPSEIRAAEARAVARIVESTDEPIRIVLGDFNEGTGKRPIRALAPGLGFYDALSDEIGRRGGDTHTYHRVPHRRRIDYILLSPEARAFFSQGSVRVRRTQFARTASDHYPLSLQLRL